MNVDVLIFCSRILDTRLAKMLVVPNFMYYVGLENGKNLDDPRFVLLFWIFENGQHADVLEFVVLFWSRELPTCLFSKVVCNMLNSRTVNMLMF